MNIDYVNLFFFSGINFTADSRVYLQLGTRENSSLKSKLPIKAIT